MNILMLDIINLINESEAVKESTLAGSKEYLELVHKIAVLRAFELEILEDFRDKELN